MERLRALPEPQRAALVMRELEGLSHEEIAAALGVSGGAARQAIYRRPGGAARGPRLLLPMPLLRALAEHGGDAGDRGAVGRRPERRRPGRRSAVSAAARSKSGSRPLLVAGAVGAGVAVDHGQGERAGPKGGGGAAGGEDRARRRLRGPGRPSSAAPRRTRAGMGAARTAAATIGGPRVGGDDCRAAGRPQRREPRLRSQRALRSRAAPAAAATNSGPGDSSGPGSGDGDGEDDHSGPAPARATTTDDRQRLRSSGAATMAAARAPAAVRAAAATTAAAPDRAAARTSPNLSPKSPWSKRSPTTTARARTARALARDGGDLASLG